MATKWIDQFNPEEKRKGKEKRGWLVLTTIFFILILIIAGLTFGFQKAYAQKFFPRIKIGYLNVGGQTKDQVLEQLRVIEDDVHSTGLQFKAEEKEIMINPIVISATDPDLAKPILVFDWEKTLKEAYQIGRGDSWWKNLIRQVKVIVSSIQIPIYYNLDQEELMVALQTSFMELEKPPINARLKIKGNVTEVVGEQSGYVFKYQKAIDQLVMDINFLDFKLINLDLIFTEPEIKKEHTGSAVNSVENILTVDSLKLMVDPNWWKLNKPQFTPWLEFQSLEGEVVVGVNKEKIFEFLEPIAERVNIEAQDAKFKLNGKRVVEFQVSRDGQKINLEESYQKINNQIMAGISDDIDLVVDVDLAKVATGDINDFGIQELLGRGTSNFAGSPRNRRHNIAVGADALNGILIAPGEEFSLLDALGDIDGENGYKQELVIKGDRTIPEYGGGLCQIGTTTFRAALYSGLPITQRRNHSYRVIYYEPAGMDATIYSPYPDMRFLNDTGHHILFTTKIEGDELVFEYYGTKDDRVAVLDPEKPRVYNITKPGEPRYIETDELPPGEKKKVESSHNGADAYFKYTVTYADGEVKETDFYSHYVVWPEVWMVGRETTTTTEEVLE